MPAVVHLVPRPHALEPSALARDLAATPWAEQPQRVRVIELFDPRPGVAGVDLTLAERDVPELTAVMHDAAELHLHGIHPRVALRCLPDVKQAVLAGISVFVHGPLAVRPRPCEAATAWPGVVAVDATAAADAVDGSPAPTRCFVDVDAPELLPRACGPLPLTLDDTGRLAVICLAESVAEPIRRQLRIELEAISRGEVRIEVYDEHDVAATDRAPRRRAAAAVIVADERPTAWSRSFVEAIAQGVPVIGLGDAPDGAPGSVHFTGARDDVTRAVAIVRSWAASWAAGDAPPVDTAARTRWLAERRAAGGPADGR